MVVDCGKYEVEFFAGDAESLVYRDKHSGGIQYIPATFKVQIDDFEDGGAIKLTWRDRWGSSMEFVRYAPSDLPGVFKFIARGYDIIDRDGCLR